MSSQIFSDKSYKRCYKYILIKLNFLRFFSSTQVRITFYVQVHNQYVYFQNLELVYKQLHCCKSHTLVTTLYLHSYEVKIMMNKIVLYNVNFIQKILLNIFLMYLTYKYYSYKLSFFPTFLKEFKEKAIISKTRKKKFFINDRTIFVD